MQHTQDLLATLEAEATELAAMEVAVETNSGTFGSAECHRAVGTGDPRYGEYTVYVRVGDGARRVVGCDPDIAPGYPRRFRAGLVAKQAELRQLRCRIRSLRHALPRFRT